MEIRSSSTFRRPCTTELGWIESIMPALVADRSTAKTTVAF